MSSSIRDFVMNHPLFSHHDHHCHFKDFAPNSSARGYGGAVFGTGVVPNQVVADELTRRGYGGWVALESYPQGGAGPRETVPPEFATLRRMFGEG